ncbi:MULTISPECIES: nuclear transport factor 2 family protein [Flavobacterium]|uniref:Nuclear transport factor 2 family protein n=1 Tax=Flavobacterium sedimenticola TaxID=3043286 RepID=A0ABT6XMA5_9FLAO|nr:nuclear transport factor 2 family protein [Flavobacterium sedimenticola]MDI9256227.1 nuclear transport factor 2 family protein [Flavobacterium sedimenticola]
MKKYVLLSIFFFSAGLINAQDTASVNDFLNRWHKAAAEAQFDTYFEAMAEESIFIGTDATENWDKKAFQAFAKPYFDKGKAWYFTALERHVYFSPDKKTAWFDELLDTQMKICRGSGVLVWVNGQWKIKHYVLSMTVPNDNVDKVVDIKSALEDPLIRTLKEKK